MDALKFVIVGHVDHGKSTLIGRLLYDTGSLAPDKIEEIKRSSRDLGRDVEFAFLLDSLREEREQGITIDTAQTFFKTPKREYVIIDAPGHREFVKNMITGASQAEAAILIVDVARGVEEQTRRHAYILAMLGIIQVLVVLNKMDLVAFEQAKFNKVSQDIEGFLASIKVKPKLYIPVSAAKGDNIAGKSKNMDWYSGPTVLASLDSLPGKVSAMKQPLILPVQDIYKIDGKRIIVGRVEAGIIKERQKIKILPQGETSEVNSLEKFLEQPKMCVAAESIGLTTTTAVFVERGCLICAPAQEPALTDAFCANIFWMAREGFNKQEKLILRCATQEISCRVPEIVRRMDSSTLAVMEEDADRLEPLEVGEVVIKTKRPIALRRFSELEELGRFVLVRNENTCAGGIITAVGQNGNQ